jgi:hypothetical protein
METSLAVRIREVNLAGLSEPQRVALIGDIRTRLAHLAALPAPDAAIFHERIDLLKHWHALAQMRVADLIADVEPPPPGTKSASMFPPEEIEESAEAEEEFAGEAEPVREGSPQKVAEEEPPPAPGDGFIPVRLLETGIVNGMRLPAGIVVDVSPEDAAHLLETGKAQHPDESPPPIGATA